MSQKCPFTVFVAFSLWTFWITDFNCTYYHREIYLIHPSLKDLQIHINTLHTLQCLKYIGVPQAATKTNWEDKVQFFIRNFLWESKLLKRNRQLCLAFENSLIVSLRQSLAFQSTGQIEILPTSGREDQLLDFLIAGSVLQEMFYLSVLSKGSLYSL